MLARPRRGTSLNAGRPGACFGRDTRASPWLAASSTIGTLLWIAVHVALRR
jgi:hypothetical protein